jgi:hypothetical protein
MEIRLEFDHDYEVELLRETVPQVGIRTWFYPGASTKGGRDGVLLRITPTEGTPWIGCFARGNFGGSAVSQVMSCPNPRELCVLSLGAGYFVNVQDPSNWKNVRAIPVCNALAVLDRHLLVFSDFTKLVAYGSNGPAWETGGISADGIRILGIRNACLDLISWDAAKQTEFEVSVSLGNGLVLTRSR